VKRLLVAAGLALALTLTAVGAASAMTHHNPTMTHHSPSMTIH
jgi:hypothetical protein